MTYYLLIRPTFSSPFCLSLSCPRQQHSVSPAPLLCTVIHHQCHSVLPFHMAQHLFGSVAHAMLKGIQTNGAMRRLEAVSPLYVWCQLACQPKQNVYPVSWWISKAVQTFHCYLLFYLFFYIFGCSHRPIIAGKAHVITLMRASLNLDFQEHDMIMLTCIHPRVVDPPPLTGMQYLPVSLNTPVTFLPSNVKIKQKQLQQLKDDQNSVLLFFFQIDWVTPSAQLQTYFKSQILTDPQRAFELTTQFLVSNCRMISFLSGIYCHSFSLFSCSDRSGCS